MLELIQYTIKLLGVTKISYR